MTAPVCSLRRLIASAAGTKCFCFLNLRAAASLRWQRAAMAYQHTFKRHQTREVRVGDKVIGGNHPIVVQSMTTPDTHDVEATVAQIHRLEEAGCELVRVTVPKAQDAAVLGEIRRRTQLPLICD